MAMKGYLLRSILPRMGLYADYLGRPRRAPSLFTIPRVHPPGFTYVPKPALLAGLSGAHNEDGTPQYGQVSDGSKYQRRLLADYFNPWAAAWLRETVSLVFSEWDSGGGGGWMPWLSAVISFNPGTPGNPTKAEGVLHEHAHAWEEAKLLELQWTLLELRETWLSVYDLWPELMKPWAREFLEHVVDQGVNTETYASTASATMGRLGLIPGPLRPYFTPLFYRA